jgi:hypothetical protein
MLSSPPVGAIAFGLSGIACKVAEVQPDRVVLLCPDGLKQVRHTAITRWELPPITRALAMGDRVKLKNTNFFYTIIEIFEVPYWISGDHTVELWARCQHLEGRIATWKLGQLETYSDCHSNKPQDL